MTLGRQDISDKPDWSEWVGGLAVMDQNYIKPWRIDVSCIYSSHLCKYQPHFDQLYLDFCDICNITVECLSLF